MSKITNCFLYSYKNRFSFLKSTLAVGQNVVCKQGTDGLWKSGVIESIENDNHLCVVRFIHFNALEAIPFESIVTTSEQIETNNEDENLIDDVSNAITDIPSSSSNQPRLGNLGDWEKHTRVSNINILSNLFIYITGYWF
jgi:hypothetical protein